MSREKVLESIINVLFTLTQKESIHEDSELVDDLEISSMDIIFLISNMEEMFDVKIKAKEIHKTYTVGDIADVVMSLME